MLTAVLARAAWREFTAFTQISTPKRERVSTSSEDQETQRSIAVLSGVSASLIK
jgi:hypothetical protein